MENAEAFLKTVGPMHLADAPGGPSFQTASADTLRRGKSRLPTSARIATRASSRRPRSRADRVKATRGSRRRCRARTSSTRTSSPTIAAIRCASSAPTWRAPMATNAQEGHVWEEFSSETYKQLPPSGKIAGLYNPRKPDEPLNSGLHGAGRLLPDAVARLDVGDGAVPAQQRARDLREGPVGSRPDAFLQRRGREAAVAGEAARRAVDDRDERSPAS